MKETRVELFKEYREEIAKMEDESSFTNKEKIVRKVNETLKNNDSQSRDTTSLTLSYEDVLDASSIYDEDDQTNTNHLTKKKSKDKIFQVVLIVTAILITVALVVIGIIAFGGKN